MKTVKIITFFILTLYLVTSSLFADDMRFNSIDWNELTIHQKTQVIQDYKDFLFNLESSKSVKLSNKKYSFFNRYIKNLFNAYASEGYDCLYGGWPSNRNTEGLCKWPQENNTKYNDYKNVCSESQLLCNPMLFGDNICIDFSTLKKRKLAYSQCESKFKKEGRDLDEVVNNIKEKDFNDLTKVIDDICNDPTVGTQHVTPICTALKTKMSKYIPNTNPKGIVHGKQDSLGVKGKLDLLQNLTNSFERDLHKFATECGEDFPKAKEVECYNLLQKLKKTEQDIEFLKEELDRTMGSVAFCKAYSETMEISENFFVTTEQATEQIACTPKEKASYKASCFKDIMCFGASSLLGVAAMAVEAMGVDTGDCIKGENSCAVQAITALIDTLWATVTGVWDLLKMGYNAASDWVSDTWNTFWDDTEEVENKTSDAQMMLSNLSADQKKQIEEDKEGWLASTMKGLWSSLKHWMSHDIYCQQWSGAPRYSTCEKPFQSDCLKCDTLFKGTCALIGAVSSEIVKTYFTGGALTLVGRGAGAAMSSSKALSAAVNGAKSLIKMPITGATKAGKWIAKTSIVQRASGYVGSNLAGTGVAVTARLATLKTSAAYKLFKSAAANTYKYTGVKGYIKVNKEAFKLGSKHASNLFKPGVPNATANTATRSGLVYNAVKSNAPPIGIPSLPAASKITNYKISKKFKTAKVFTDATEDIQRQSLKRFSDAVDVDEEIVRLMDKAHLAPKGFAKNKQIKLLIDEVSKRPGMNKVKAQNLILGEVNADGVRVGGLASEDILVLGDKVNPEIINALKRELQRTGSKLDPMDFYEDIAKAKNNIPKEHFNLKKVINKKIRDANKAQTNPPKPSPQLEPQIKKISSADDFNNIKINYSSNKLIGTNKDFKSVIGVANNSVAKKIDGFYEKVSSLRRNEGKIFNEAFDDVISGKTKISESLEEFGKRREVISKELQKMTKEIPKDLEARKAFDELTKSLSIESDPVKLKRFWKNVKKYKDKNINDLTKNEITELRRHYKDISGLTGEFESSLLMNVEKRSMLIKDQFPNDFKKLSSQSLKDREIDLVTPGTNSNSHIWNEVKTLGGPLHKEHIIYDKIVKQAIDQNKIIKELSLNNSAASYYVEKQRLILPDGITKSASTEIINKFKIKTGMDLEIVGKIYPD